ncbi:hypothetical protein QZH41_013077, partial [Actinostola sp. cb2023]
VPVHPEGLPQPSFRVVDAPKKTTNFKLPGKLLNSEEKRKGKSPCNYDLNRMDVEWLSNLNKCRCNKGRIELEEEILEKAISYQEDKCYENLGYAIVTQEGLSIEYDESVCCDVCQSPDSEEGNEMVFCDSCDICVHQACYGIQNIPSGSWLCQPCSRAVSKPPCQLCRNPGGAMKRTKKGKNWAHVSCALWVPEVGFGSVERMDPIIKIENIPASRWNLVCYLCREKVGACIQCTVKTCMTAFHVTCGFKHGLEMRTVLDDTAVDGVKHLCYCAKHGHKNKSPPRTPEKKLKQDAEDAENQRQKRLKQMETEFYKYVDVSEAAKDLNMTKELASRIHAFWTLKRKARDDVPLLPPTLEQQEKLCGKQVSQSFECTTGNPTNNAPQGAASRTLQIQIEELMKIRCDLERLRNLCYMVSKREKLRRELYRVREQVFWKAHDVMTDDTFNIDGSELQWMREACGKNFSSDGSEPTTEPSFDNCSEPVSSSCAPSCSSEKTNTEDLRGEQSHSNEPSDCSEDDVRGGYESSDSEDSPRIKTRRRSRGFGSRKSQKDFVSRIKSGSKDGQQSTSVNKSSGAKDESDHKDNEDVEPIAEGTHTPRRSLRFHRVNDGQEGSSEEHHKSKGLPDENEDIETLHPRQKRTGGHKTESDHTTIAELQRPRTRGQTSESTSDEMDSESLRSDDTPSSPSRTLRSCKKAKQGSERLRKKSSTPRNRSKSMGDIDSMPCLGRETRSARLRQSSLSQSEEEDVILAAATPERILPTNHPTTSRIPDKETMKENKVLKENYVRARGTRNRTISQGGTTEETVMLPRKRPRVDVRRRSKGQNKRARLLDEDSDDVQARITDFFYKGSPKQNRVSKSPKATFRNGYKSPRSTRSTESENSKSDEENTEDRVQRLSSLRSFSTGKDNLPQSPCPKCQIQHDQKRGLSRSPERKNQELRARNMQSPKSRGRLLSSLRCSPTRSCSNLISQVCHAASVV